MLKPREAIPEIEFADCVLQKHNHRYVYLSNPETRGSPLTGWQHLRLRADKAKVVWLRGQAAMPECVSGVATHRPSGTRKVEAPVVRYELVSDLLFELLPDDAGFSDSERYLSFWISTVQDEWRRGNIDMLRRVPGQEQPKSISCLGRKLTIDLDDRNRSIRCVICSDDPFGRDSFEEPFITDQHIDYLKRKHCSGIRGNSEIEGKDKSQGGLPTERVPVEALSDAPWLQAEGTKDEKSGEPAPPEHTFSSALLPGLQGRRDGCKRRRENPSLKRPD